jgi:four helix bundle protein
MDDRSARLDALEARTLRFALDVLAFLDETPMPNALRMVMQQLANAASSVSANHRTVRRSRSTREFAAKLQVVNEETDEAVHWLELLNATGKVRSTQLVPLIEEGRELRAIFSTARKTLKRRMRQ